MQTSLIAWRWAKSISSSIVAQFAERARRLGAAAQPRADPYADDGGDIGQRQEKIVRHPVAEHELRADAERPNDGEKERGGDRGDRMAGAENDRRKRHEAAPGGHAIGEDRQAAERELGAAKGAKHAAETERDQPHPRRADADAARREGVLAGGGKLKPEPGAAEKRPEGEN